AGKRVLEVGCGMGTDLLQYATGGANVVGCDLTLRHLQLATKRFSLYNRRGAFVNADAENLGFKNDSFDFVFSNGVLHHTADTAGAVQEVLRVLKPGGEALIILYHRNSLVYRLQILLKSGTKRFLGKLLRGQNPFSLSVSKILSASTDGESNPLTKVFSRREGLDLMTGFSNVTTDVYHLNKGDFPLSRLFPQKTLDWLSRSVGWYLVLRGVKK
ncbi:MAG TPA: class I SAM-dependent methyltransferase, partial [Bacteroidota bacterium]